MVFLISGIPALLLLRRRPEDMGLLPDGAATPPGRQAEEGQAGSTADCPKKAAPEEEELVWTRAQATHTRAFWALSTVTCLIPFIQAGYNFHLYPFLTDQGFSQANAVLVLSIAAVCGMPGSVIWGMMTERFLPQKVMAVNLLGGGLIFLALYLAVRFRIGGISGTLLVFGLACLHGIFHGGRSPLITILWANFFGRLSMGSIYSLVNPAYFTANALGPIFAGFCFDLWGSYTFPFLLFVGIFSLSGAVSGRMRAPVPPRRGQDGS